MESVNAAREMLANKLWLMIAPMLQPGQLRGSDMAIYRLLPGASVFTHQAEALFVALEARSHRDAFTALLSAERWGAIAPFHGDYELKALLGATTSAAAERIAFALPSTDLDGTRRVKLEVVK